MTEPRQSDQNPYRSPDLSGSAEGVSRSGPIFGLREPIRVEGVRSAEDFRAATEALGGRRFTYVYCIVVFGIAVIVVPAVFVLAEGLSPLTLGVSVSTGLVVWGLISLLLVVIPRRSERKSLQQLESKAVRERFTITEEAIEAATDTASLIVYWGAFSGHRATCGTVVLFLKSSTTFHFVPRSFFADQAQWETFVELVKCKLPEQELQEWVREDLDAQPGLCLDSADGAAPVNGGPQPRSGERIVVEGVPSPAEFRHALRRFSGWSWLRLLPLLLLGVFASLAVLSVLNEKLESRVRFPLCFAAAAVVVFLVLPRWRLRQQWRQRKGAFEPRRWVITEDCLEVTTPTERSTLQWGSIPKCTQTGRMLILHLDESSFHFIPRSFFHDPGQWNALLRLVEEKVSGSE